MKEKISQKFEMKDLGISSWAWKWKKDHD